MKYATHPTTTDEGEVWESKLGTIDRLIHRKNAVYNSTIPGYDIGFGDPILYYKKDEE